MNEDVLDWKDGLSRVLNKRDLYVRLLGKFMESERDSATKVEQAIKSGDLDAARQQVHSTKGVAANLGAKALVAAAMELEMALKAGVDITAPLNRFSTVHLDTLITIQAFLQQ